VLDEGDGSVSGACDESVADVDEFDQNAEASMPPESTTPARSTSSTSLAGEVKTPSVEDLSKKKQQSRLSGSGLRAPAMKSVLIQVVLFCRCYSASIIIIRAKRHYFNWCLCINIIIYNSIINIPISLPALVQLIFLLTFSSGYFMICFTLEI